MTIASGGTPHDQYESVDEEKGTQPSQAQVEVQLSLQAALSASVLSGILFGIALHRSDVFRVETIRDQMLMKNFDMLKVFLFAAGVSTAALTLLRIVPGTHHLLERSAQDHRSSLGFPATTLGAFLLGAGMTISGSCPGTVYAQIGSGDVAAFYTVLGLVLGAGVFGFLQPSLRAFVSWKAMESRHTAWEYFGISPAKLGAAVTVLLLGGAALAEALEPTDALAPEGSSLWSAARWHPMACGALIGLIQFPLTLGVTKNAGSSSSYVIYVALLLYPLTKEHPYFRANRNGIRSYWQVLYVWSAALGAFLAYQWSSNDTKYEPSEATFAWWEGVVGGFIMAFGARLAAGCTSGHGISGVGHLLLRSFVAVGAMFAGGIAMAFAAYR